MTNSDAATTGPVAQVQPVAQVHPATQLYPATPLYPATLIAPTAEIASTAVIDAPFRPLLDGRRLRVELDTVVGEGVWIGHYTTVGQGVKIGNGSILENFVGVEPGTVIGPRVLVSSRSLICMGATVGRDSVIKGYIGDNSKVGAGCRIFGDLIHRQLDPSIPWDDPAGEEPAPTVDDGAFVGWSAVIVGGVRIGAGAYVCAGALITKNVPAGYVASGRNRIMPPGAWTGRLAKSPFMQGSRRSRPLKLRHWRPPLGQDQRGGDLGDAWMAVQQRNSLRVVRTASDAQKPKVPESAGRHRRTD